jgi:hypothetical protein
VDFSPKEEGSKEFQKRFNRFFLIYVTRNGLKSANLSEVLEDFLNKLKPN